MSNKITREEYNKLKERVEDLEDMLTEPWAYPSSLNERFIDLRTRFYCLYEYLGVEEITQPEKTLVKKRPTQAVKPRAKS